MKPLPPSETYERELMYMPYRDSLRAVIDIVASKAKPGERVLDLMCGPGYLLRKIKERRCDLSLKGVDLDERYIAYAQEVNPFIHFVRGNVIGWSSDKKFDVVLCTGALHHLSYPDQPRFVENMASLISPEGFGIVSDCYIDDYSTGQERKVAAARLGYEYLDETIRRGAPDDVIAATIDIIHNDVLGHEFKTSVKKRFPIFKKSFKSVCQFKIWPSQESEYGDYITILENPIQAQTQP